MQKSLKDIWDERYKTDEFAYGEEPNVFLKEQIDKLEPGKILFPAEGEGRNAVYAAKLGWDVVAYDISAEGKKKALKLVDKTNVKIDYKVGELENFDFHSDEFDVIAFIFAHFPATIKSEVHRNLDKLLRSGGIIIFEGFSKTNLEYVAKNQNVGGPRDIDMLFFLEEIRTYFTDYEIIMLKETTTQLSEGLYHNGVGSVVRFVGRKK